MFLWYWWYITADDDDAYDDDDEYDDDNADNDMIMDIKIRMIIITFIITTKTGSGHIW